MKKSKVLLFLICFMSFLSTIAFGATTARVSVSTAGVQGNGNSYRPSVSADGRYVAFESESTNFVSGAIAGAVYVRDQVTNVTEQVDVASDGTPANSSSYSPKISADGRYVVFVSNATNLVPGDTNAAYDIFVHDRVTGATERVSVSSSGAEANNSSGQPGAGGGISADGRYVTFYSDASNLVDGDTNGVSDVFVHDRQTGVTERVSVGLNGVEGNAYSYEPSISADGRYVSFTSRANNLVANDGCSGDDIFVRDRVAGVTEIVSVTSSGAPSQGRTMNSSISGDGRYVAFTGMYSNLVPLAGWNSIFVHDRQTGTTQVVSVSNTGTIGNTCEMPAISANGRYIAFDCKDPLVAEDTNESYDIFVRDLVTNITERVSVASDGSQTNDWDKYSRYSFYAAISGDGRYVAFQSRSAQLVPNDTNGMSDVFVRDRAAQ